MSYFKLIFLYLYEKYVYMNYIFKDVKKHIHIKIVLYSMFYHLMFYYIFQVAFFNILGPR